MGSNAYQLIDEQRLHSIRRWRISKMKPGFLEITLPIAKRFSWDCASTTIFLYLVSFVAHLTCNVIVRLNSNDIYWVYRYLLTIDCFMIVAKWLDNSAWKMSGKLVEQLARSYVYLGQSSTIEWIIFYDLYQCSLLPYQCCLLLSWLFTPIMVVYSYISVVYSYISVVHSYSSVVYSYIMVVYSYIMVVYSYISAVYSYIMHVVYFYIMVVYFYIMVVYSYVSAVYYYIMHVVYFYIMVVYSYIMVVYSYYVAITVVDHSVLWCTLTLKALKYFRINHGDQRCFFQNKHLS